VSVSEVQRKFFDFSQYSTTDFFSFSVVLYWLKFSEFPLNLRGSHWFKFRLWFMYSTNKTLRLPLMKSNLVKGHWLRTLLGDRVVTNLRRTPSGIEGWFLEIVTLKTCEANARKMILIIALTETVNHNIERCKLAELELILTSKGGDLSLWPTDHVVECAARAPCPPASGLCLDHRFTLRGYLPVLNWTEEGLVHVISCSADPSFFKLVNTNNLRADRRISCIGKVSVVFLLPS